MGLPLRLGRRGPLPCLAWLLAAAALTAVAFYYANLNSALAMVVDPVEFGARPHSSFDSTQAIQRAIDSCATSRVCNRVRLGCAQEKCEYASGSLFLRSRMTFEVAAGVTLLAANDPALFPMVYSRFEGTLRMGHAALLNVGGCVAFKEGVDPFDAAPGPDHCQTWERLEDVVITGDGVIDGQGAWWWDQCFRSKEQLCPDGHSQRLRPSLVKAHWVTGLTLTRLTFRDSPFWFIHPVFCNKVRVDHIAVVAPASSKNTDGFDPDSCRDVHVSDSVFETGDDCIAIKSGRGAGAWAVGLATEDVVVENCEFRNGHGVTIGSEMSGGVRNVTFRNSRVVHTKAAFRIKTARGRGGEVADVLFENMTVSGTPVLLSIDMNYEDHKTTKNLPVLRSIRLRQIRSENVGRMAVLDCLPDSPCTDIELTDVRVSGDTGGFDCRNAYGIEADVYPHRGCLRADGP